MSQKKKLIENISSLYFLQGVNYLLPLVVLPYLVRVLGAELFGLLVFAQALNQYFNILTDYGFNLSVTKKIAETRGDLKKISEISRNVITIKFLLIIGSFLLLILAILLVQKFTDFWPVFLISFLQVIGNALFPVWFFQGIERMKIITLSTMLGRGIATISIFLFVNQQSDYVLAAGLQAAGWLIAGIIAFSWMLKIINIRISPPPIKDLIKELKDGWHIFISTAAIGVYTASNIVILGLITNNTVVAYFGGAEKITKAVQGLLSPISQSIYPYISALRKESLPKMIGMLRKSFFSLAAFGLILTLVLLLGAPLIIKILFGSEFQSSIPVLMIMAPIPFLVAMSNIFGIQTMLPFDLKSEFSKILISAGIINLILIIPFSYLWAANGAALAVMISEFFVTITMGVVLKKNNLFFFNPRVSQHAV